MAGLTYRCSCSRATFATWARDHGDRWVGPGCPGECRARTLPGDAVTSLRVDLGGGVERFVDLLVGSRSGPVAPDGDLVIRDRAGNWTYGFAVVVDDIRQGVDLVVRGDDLIDETPRQIRLGRRLGRASATHYLHHPLIRKPSGAKLSKSDGDTGVRDLRAAGWTAVEVRTEAARLGQIPGTIGSAATGGQS